MTGGVFTVTIWSAGQKTALGEASTEENILWDRKRDGGFPGMSNLIQCTSICASEKKLTNLAEVKALKSLVRNVIAPNRDLGHTDRALKKQAEEKKQQEPKQDDEAATKKKECEDCI
jgi:predicted Rdx family selenoprotein